MAEQSKGRRERAVLYLRQSTFREESISLELQETACRKYATQRGYDVVAVEADPGVSGRTFKRPGVQSVMTLIEEQRADVILLWKWSRLSRNRLDWYIAADRCQAAGGRIESATEPIDTSTSIGRLSRGMMIEIAAFESERAGDQWREAGARRIRNGLPHDGKPRFGYEYDPAAKEYRPHPVTGPIFADLYRRFAAGETLYGLCVWLNTHQVPTVKGGPWTAANLRQIMDREFAVGRVFHQGAWHPGAHEPLITEAEFAAYKQARKLRGARPRAEASEYLLSGLAKCGVCDRQLTGATARGRWFYYRCFQSRFTGEHSYAQVSTRVVEDAVYEKLRERAAEIAAVPVTAAPPRPAVDVASLKRAVQQHTTALTQLTVQLAEHVISPDAYGLAAPALEQKLAAARDALEAATAEVAAPPVEDAVVSLVEDWHILPVGHRRALLARTVETVSVDFNDEKRVDVQLREPRSVVRVGEP